MILRLAFYVYSNQDNMMLAEEKTHTNDLANYRSQTKKAHKYT